MLPINNSLVRHIISRLTIVSLDNLYSIGAIVSLNQPQYVVMESADTLSGMITLNRKASKDVIVEVTISNGSAHGNV